MAVFNTWKGDVRISRRLEDADDKKRICEHGPFAHSAIDVANITKAELDVKLCAQEQLRAHKA
jgi:hypothetical protein